MMSAEDIAAVVDEGFARYRHRFDDLTARAAVRFRDQDWAGMQADAAERLDVYQDCLETVVADLGRRFPETAGRGRWRRAKRAFESRTDGLREADLAETFFNSVARRRLRTDGVDPETEFVRPQAPPLPPLRPGRDIRGYGFGDAPVEAVIRRVMAESGIGALIADPAADAVRVARAMARQLGGRAPASLEVLTPVFYRGMGAYLIGKLTAADGAVRPWSVAFIHRDGRIAADGVVTGERGIRIIFSYTHSYFFAATDNVGGLVGFLHGILPHRRRAELYISLGCHRHGKTELYRELTQHQHACTDMFVISPGKPGMVMVVFNMPSDNLVFKVIRDRFEAPKRTTRREVMAKYDYIFRHDRTGRLPDAQTFEHLRFNRGCFHPALIDELRRTAAGAVTFAGDTVSLARVYVERRVTPLDVYLQAADADRARAAVVDFGQAIKDMAASDIFPGDLLIKNFGVTELGRVIFYDYDEVCPVTECRFRAKPRGAHDDMEMAAAPWYLVEENDVFPEEFPSFLGLHPSLRQVLASRHGEIFTPEFWRANQDRIRSGALTHVFPYPRLEADR